MLYIKPENRDTRYALWYETYLVLIPYIQTIPLEELEENGLPTSGDKHHDHAMQWEPKLIRIPIVKMAEYWRSGASVSLVNRDDALTIYKAISAHLHAWKDYIETAYHTVTPPTDDLLVLDEFATVIYEHAKLTYTRSFITKHFALTNQTSTGRRNILAAMASSEERRLNDKKSEVLVTRNIEVIEPAPIYNSKVEAKFVDYSGKAMEINVPDRDKLSDFFKKEKR